LLCFAYILEKLESLRPCIHHFFKSIISKHDNLEGK
jgi:hypothetical protein